ncbi:hypothetical protein BACCIP111895_00836 [Neobacillus rhizosphaerae]|uniref:DUF2533 domain-containing protein n=1 Tax=Neobacillus rhizosphaerae TaxID=2880965 RepID=A0ABM9EM43_9BACI|nr:DUF2533 family protein [Neobacillus rhizosphaerae]CAH2713682.1 hypothetical protein BACCIP111895_00836 [Neobacillus rhizosphaerae]
MSVHKDLIKHAEKQNKIYKMFLALDQQRESFIEEALELCKHGSPFSTDKINEVTNKINKINLRFIPTRKNVTVDMIKDYVKNS